MSRLNYSWPLIEFSGGRREIAYISMTRYEAISIEYACTNISPDSLKGIGTQKETHCSIFTVYLTPINYLYNAYVSYIVS